MIEINRQFQDRHVAGSDIDRWVELQQVERDICLLYHQLSDYSYIMGDLYYGSDVAAPVFADVIAESLRLLAVPPDAMPARDPGNVMQAMADRAAGR